MRLFNFFSILFLISFFLFYFFFFLINKNNHRFLIFFIQNKKLKKNLKKCLFEWEYSILYLFITLFIIKMH